MTTSIVLALEPDRDQAARLRVIVSSLGADLVLAGSAAAAFEALGARVPDLILTPALLSSRDESILAERLRAFGDRAAHVQSVTVPRFSVGTSPRKSTGFLGRFRRGSATPQPEPNGCDPHVFAQEIAAYLQRARVDRVAAEPVLDILLTVEEPALAEPAFTDAALEEAAEEVAFTETAFTETAFAAPAFAEAALAERPVEEPALSDPPIDDEPVAQPMMDAAAIDEPAVEVIAAVEVPVEEAAAPLAASAVLADTAEVVDHQDAIAASSIALAESVAAPVEYCEEVVEPPAEPFVPDVDVMDADGDSPLAMGVELAPQESTEEIEPVAAYVAEETATEPAFADDEADAAVAFAAFLEAEGALAFADPEPLPEVQTAAPATIEVVAAETTDAEPAAIEPPAPPIEIFVAPQPREEVLVEPALMATPMPRDDDAAFAIMLDEFDEIDVTALLDEITNSEPAVAAPAQLRVESVSASPAPKARKAKTPRPPAAPRQVAAPSPRPRRPKAPAQDEWGLFDPEQCGFAALVAKLDEVTDDDDRRAGSSARVVSYS
jgi:hypothetical protein